MFHIFTFIVLIALSAFFSACETAYFSIRDSEVRMMERKKLWNAKLVARLKRTPQRLLITVLVGNNLVNISIASLATVVGMDYFDSFGAGIATGVSAVVILLLGEVFPKSIAITYKKRVTQLTALPLFVMYLVCYPVSILFFKLEQWLQKKFHIHKANIVSEEEIRIMAELGLEHGEIDHAERTMIENIFEFDDIPVGKIMTHTAAVDALNGEVPVAQIAHYVSQSGFSRFPVYDGNPENYIGYVHTNDVMRTLNSDDRDLPISTFASPLSKVSEKENIAQVFRLMTKNRSHIYLVHKENDPDEIVGLVTMEDILGEIVGEIEDEGDGRAVSRK